MTSHCVPGTKPPSELSFFTSAFSLVLSATITVGNVLIILAILKDPYGKLRNPFAFFLVNAAISDFTVGVLAMPVSFIIHYMEGQRQISHTYTIILHMTYFVSASASLSSIAAMAIDRYLALTSITVRQSILTRKNCIFVSFLIWIFAIGFSGFYFLTGFVTLLFIYVYVSLILSFGITLLTYLNVLCRMRRTLKFLKQQGEMTTRGNRDCSSFREKKVTEVFFSLLITYIGIYLPALVLINLLKFCSPCHCNIIHVSRDVAFLLISAASATNPMVCLLKMPIIRKSLMEIVKCRRRRSTVEDIKDSAL